MLFLPAGSVNTGAIDPLEELGDLCASEELWFHVDGAYGAMACVSKELRPLFAGLERADSVAADPHKWLYMPYEAGATLVREPGLLFACRYKKEAEDGSEEKITRRRWNCWNCFNQQCTAAAHKAHVAFCHENTCQKIRMPRQGQLLSYEEGGSRESLTAYMLFFDFEALSVPPQRVCSCPPDVLAATDIARGLMGEVAREEMAVEQLMLEGEAEEVTR